MLKLTSNRLHLMLVILAVAGCSTIRNARNAQEEVAAAGRGEVTASGRVSLKGASLETMVAFAMTNRPSVVSARLAVEDARLAMREIAADAPILSDTPWTAPKLSVNGGYAESSTGATFSRGGWEMSGDPSAAISLELLVYDFGRYGAKAKKQAELTVAAERNLSDVGFTVFNEVAKSYCDFLENCSLLDVARVNERLYRDHLERTEAKLKVGEAFRLDILKARLDLASARKAVVSASNLVDTTGAELMNAIGVDASRGTWETVVGRPKLGTDQVRRAFARTSFTVDESYAFARTNAPAMCVKRANLRAASHAVDYAVADLYPSVSVSGSFSWTDPLWYWKWGVTGVQSIFQGFKKTTAVDRAVVAMKTARVDVDNAEQQLSVDLETAIANRDNSIAAIESAVAAVKSAKENLDSVQAQLKVGEVSRIELSDAIASHSTATGDCITAFYDGQRAEAKLFALLGKYPVYREEIVKGK